jgi:curved DNA-binding protein CbpA
MTEANPYVLMGVGQAASKEEIHDAYRKLAKRYHPDLNPGDAAAERSFKEIAAAYELLSDPLERARFDREHDESIAGGGLHEGAPGGTTAGDPVGSGPGAGTAPRWRAAADAFRSDRSPTVEDTGFDPDKGYAITEPDDRRRLLVLMLVVALLLSLVVELSGFGHAWRPRPAGAATPLRVNPMTIGVGIAVFVAACGAFVAWIMNGVERRARANDGKPH